MQINVKVHGESERGGEREGEGVGEGEGAVSVAVKVGPVYVRRSGGGSGKFTATVTFGTRWG